MFLLPIQDDGVGKTFASICLETYSTEIKIKKSQKEQTCYSKAKWNKRFQQFFERRKFRKSLVNIASGDAAA